MDTIGKAQNLNTKSKVAESQVALSNQLKLNAKKQKHDLVNTNVVECLGKMGK